MFHLCQEFNNQKATQSAYTVVARKELLTSFEEAIEQGCVRRILMERLNVDLTSI